MAAQKKLEDSVMALIRAVDKLEKAVGMVTPWTLAANQDYQKIVAEVQGRIKEAKNHLGSTWTP